MGLIKNIEKSTVLDFENIVDYQDDKVVSLTLAQEPGVGVTLFAFDKGEGVSAHSASGDALVVILDGKAQITVDGVVHEVSKGESIVMPGNVPHALKAIERFKMVLTVIK